MLFISLLLSCFSFFESATTPASVNSEAPGPLFISSDHGASWDDFAEGLPLDLAVRDVLEHEGTIYLTSTRHGVYVLPKFSCTWQQQNEGLPLGGVFEFFPTSLAAKGKLLVLGTFNHGVFHSTDGAKTWQVARQNISDVVGSLTILEDNTILAGAHKGLWKSTDGGVNWAIVNETGYRINALAEHNGMLFVAKQNGMGILNGTEVDWNNMSTKWAIIQLLSEGDYLYAITAQNEVFRSKDGQFWENNALSMKGILGSTLPEALWNGLSPKLPSDLAPGLITATSRGWIVGVGGGC